MNPFKEKPMNLVNSFRNWKQLYPKPYNKNDIDNKDNRIPISAMQLNRIEDAISAVVNHENDMMMHWWKRSKIVDAIVETMPKITSGDYGILSGKVNCFTDSSSTIKLYYSDSDE